MSRERKSTASKRNSAALATKPFMNRLLVVGVLFAGCFQPVEVGSNDAGHDGGVSPCTIGLDQTCNELESMSALAGVCTATGCTCSAGFEKGPSGKCRPVGACPSTPQQPGGSCTAPGLVCSYGYAPIECGGRTVRCQGSSWTEVEHTDPQPSCNRDGGTCSGSGPLCVMGTPGGLCGDGALQPTCTNGAWVCPAGTIEATRCACTGLRPGCTCTATGWQCADAGTVCTPGIAMSCNDGPVDGGVGGVAGTCTTNGTCVCLSGFHPNPATGRCAADLGCTNPQLDATCNELQVMASFAGRRCAEGHCSCSAGYELNPSGRCQPIGAVCTDRVAMSCNDGAAGTSIGGIAGSCVVGQCVCSSGFLKNAITQLCRRPLEVTSLSNQSPFETETITVNGSGFTPGTKVVIRGIVATVSARSATSLSVVVPDYADILPGAPVAAQFEVQDLGMPSVPVSNFRIRGM